MTRSSLTHDLLRSYAGPSRPMLGWCWLSGLVAHPLRMSTQSTTWELESLLSVTKLAECPTLPMATIYHWRAHGQLSTIIEVMLGTSARTGEALAIRRRDVDVTGVHPSVSIRGTIAAQHGEPPYRRTIRRPRDHAVQWRSRRSLPKPAG